MTVNEGSFWLGKLACQGRTAKITPRDKYRFENEQIKSTERPRRSNKSPRIRSEEPLEERRPHLQKSGKSFYADAHRGWIKQFVYWYIHPSSALLFVCTPPPQLWIHWSAIDQLLGRPAESSAFVQGPDAPGVSRFSSDWCRGTRLVSLHRLKTLNHNLYSSNESTAVAMAMCNFQHLWLILSCSQQKTGAALQSSEVETSASVLTGLDLQFLKALDQVDVPPPWPAAEEPRAKGSLIQHHFIHPVFQNTRKSSAADTMWSFPLWCECLHIFDELRLQLCGRKHLSLGYGCFWNVSVLWHFGDSPIWSEFRITFSFRRRGPKTWKSTFSFDFIH